MDIRSIAQDVVYLLIAVAAISFGLAEVAGAKTPGGRIAAALLLLFPGILLALLFPGILLALLVIADWVR